MNIKNMKYFLPVIIFLFFNLPLFASYDEAIKLFNEKKYKESLQKVAEVLVIADDLKPGSENYKLRYLAAHNHWKLGNTEAVVAHFKRCMVIEKDNIDPYIDLALYMLELNRYNDAVRIAKSGLLKQKDPMLFYILGRVSLARKSYWQSKELFEKANALDPEIFILYHNLGIVLMNLNKYGQANVAFSVAIAINSKSPETLNNLGLSFEKLGKKKQALKYYKEALELDKENSIIIKNIKRVKGLKRNS